MHKFFKYDKISNPIKKRIIKDINSFEFLKKISLNFSNKGIFEFVNFFKPEQLPKLMVAPNGARPMKKDHPKVPITISEIVRTGKACFDVGADAIHFHIRDKKEYMF